MRWDIALCWLVISAALCSLVDPRHPLTFPLLWPALSFLIVGLGYLSNRPAVFGKLNSGEFSVLHRVLLLPYLLFADVVWRINRRAKSGRSRASAEGLPEDIHRLLPDVLLGPRLLGPPPSEVKVVCDLTCEFAEPRAVTGGREYICFPILDGSVPTTDSLIELCQRPGPGGLDHLPGTLYIHCAQGVGRTGLVAAALLLHRRLASTADEAVAMVRAARPGVRLNSLQMRCLREFHEAIQTVRPT